MATPISDSYMKCVLDAQVRSYENREILKFLLEELPDVKAKFDFDEIAKKAQLRFREEYPEIYAIVDAEEQAIVDAEEQVDGDVGDGAGG